MKRKIISLCLCLFLLCSFFCTKVLASTDWPDELYLESDAGIVMDADTGIVLFGKNIHDTYAPASITKVLTALIVLERCSLDETVTFSFNAVHNVEANSTSAGYETGDKASVKDCLYALLLKSANESGNALAEHVAGSIEDFAGLMNERARELGCQDSHFNNPSGLNDENHYVSAYDMALITRAAFENETFSKIVATTYYKLPPSKNNPDGLGISPGNRMVKRNFPDQYRPDVIGGKTGFTSIALNTLVIGAQQGDTKLVTVVLHSRSTQYKDTKRLLDFGFSNFQSVRIADYDQTFSSIGDDLKIAGLPTSTDQVLSINPDSRIILPKTADISETTISLDYQVPPSAPEGTIGCVNYQLGDRPVGQAYLTFKDSLPELNETLPDELLEVNPASMTPGQEAEGVPAADPGDTAGRMRSLPEEPAESGSGTQDTKQKGDSRSLRDLFAISIPFQSIIFKALVAVLALVLANYFILNTIKKNRAREEAAVLERRRRRAERLREAGISEAEFDLMMQEKRQAAASDKQKKRSGGGRMKQ